MTEAGVSGTRSTTCPSSTWVRAPGTPIMSPYSSARGSSASARINSVAFRCSGQDFTAVGTFVELTSRLLVPTLLALAFADGWTSAERVTGLQQPARSSCLQITTRGMLAVV